MAAYDLAFGIIGTLMAIPTLLALIIFILPRTRLKALDKEVSETRDYLILLEGQGNPGIVSRSAYFERCMNRCVD